MLWRSGARLGILVVGVAARPLACEVARRVNAVGRFLTWDMRLAVTIPNDELLQTIDRQTPLLN